MLMHLPLQGLTTSRMTHLLSRLVPTSQLLTLSLSLQVTLDPSMNPVLNLAHFLSLMPDLLVPHVHMTTMVNHQTPLARPQTLTHRLHLLLAPVG